MLDIIVIVAGLLVILLMLCIVGTLFALLSRFEKFEKKIDNSVSILNNTIINHSPKLRNTEILDTENNDG